MNLTDLRHIFDAAVSRSKSLNREDIPDEAHRDAGLKAVVEALWKETADRGHYELHTMFEEILGGRNDAG